MPSGTFSCLQERVVTLALLRQQYLTSAVAKLNYRAIGASDLERRLIREVELHLAYRWFCKLDIEDEIPHHATFSVNRLGANRDSVDVPWTSTEAFDDGGGAVMTKADCSMHSIPPSQCAPLKLALQRDLRFLRSPKCHC
jgi:hypothetical protein